ncbi:MAG: hypothetical protein KME06_02840 [Kastovskya adunca ATA6-11-RM4]|nr:hypothetical protein [Kastovskya adunca ATA6-11-RM4]
MDYAHAPTRELVCAATICTSPVGLKDVKAIAKLHTNNAIFNSVGCDRYV